MYHHQDLNIGLMISGEVLHSVATKTDAYISSYFYTP